MTITPEMFVTVSLIAFPLALLVAALVGAWLYYRGRCGASPMPRLPQVRKPVQAEETPAKPRVRMI